MNRWLAVAVVAAMLAVPAVSAADWTQSGYDAARTDHVPQQGPATNDTAFEVKLPGGYAPPPAVGQGPLVLDGQAYVPVRPVGPEDLGLTANGLARVDLATADVSIVVTLEDEVIQGTAADDDYIYLATNRGVTAYERSGFESVWSWELPNPVEEEDEIQNRAEAQQFCGPPAVRDGRLYVGCVVQRSATYQGSLAALDRETGQREWIWNTTDDPSQGSPEPQVALLLGFSVIGDHVITTRLSQTAAGPSAFAPDLPCEACDNDGYTAKRNVSILALDADEGSLEWSHGRSTTYAEAEAADQTLTPPSQMGFEDIPGQTWQPTGTPGAIYAKLGDRVKALNPAQGGQVIWDEPVGQEDTGTGTGDPRGAALSGDRLFVLSATTLYRFDTSQEAIDWTTLLPPERGETFTRGELILAGDTLYASSAQRYPNNQPDGTTLYGFNATSGDIQWQRYLSQGAWATNNGVDIQHFHSVADGVLVTASTDGMLTAIGETEASLGAPNVDTERFPEAGDEVTIDASDTEPGAFGEASRYMVDWGDGTVTGWQESPTFTHAYEDEGAYDARVYAGNDANQTNSNLVTMNVGQEEPNWLSERFEPGNQDMTFGILGVVLALGGGAFGVARRKRRKSLLEDELDALEEGYEETKDRPSECEALLDNRKARARSLALDDKLDEQQVSILENRADELRGELRVSMLDERFAFLPHGMVRTLERMLEDGRINAWEKETFLNALDEQEMLTEEQKGKVERLIGQWIDDGGVER